MSIQALTSTSTFLATRRQRSPSPQTILENRIPLLRPIPLLHPMLLPLMSDLPLILSFFFLYLCFAGPRTQDVCSFFLNKYSFFTTFVCTCAFHVVPNRLRGCMVRIERLG